MNILSKQNIGSSLSIQIKIESRSNIIKFCLPDFAGYFPSDKCGMNTRASTVLLTLLTLLSYRACVFYTEPYV